MINHFVTALFLMGKWRGNCRSSMESGEKPDDLTMLVEHFYSLGAMNHAHLQSNISVKSSTASPNGDSQKR